MQVAYVCLTLIEIENWLEYTICKIKYYSQRIYCTACLGRVTVEELVPQAARSNWKKAIVRLRVSEVARWHLMWLEVKCQEHYENPRIEQLAYTTTIHGLNAKMIWILIVGTINECLSANSSRIYLWLLIENRKYYKLWEKLQLLTRKLTASRASAGLQLESSSLGRRRVISKSECSLYDGLNSV